MVWGLFPVDPLPGEAKYYFFNKGTYKVGRKGCDIIISKDKGVSRVHAEFIIIEMVALDPLQKYSNISSRVQIRDCSKYGTFINKGLDSMQKVHELPRKETILKDGDLVSFGTGNATYRFCSIPLVFFLCSYETLRKNQVLQEKISSIGACVSRTWSPQCSHALLEESTPLKDDLFDALLARKPIVRHDWVEFIAGKDICTEMPSYSSYAPVLLLDGVPIKVIDPQSREHCLAGYTFLLGPRHEYEFTERLQSLVEVAGAKVVSVEAFCPSSQGLEEESKNNVVLVIPAKSADIFEYFRNLRSLRRMNEMDLVSAILSGHLDPSLMVTAPVLVTSSCSTDETVVADSDVEAESAMSIRASEAVCSTRSSQHSEMENAVIQSKNHGEDHSRGGIVHITESVEDDDKAHGTVNEIKSEADSKTNSAVHGSEGNYTTCFTLKDESKLSALDKRDDLESKNSDIIFSQNLIVRDSSILAPATTTTYGEVKNFKRFRKTNTPSGNSFSSLIPFSKYPYREAEDGSEELAEAVKEEKRRKQLEAVAEDLFKYEKGRKTAAGSLRRAR